MSKEARFTFKIAGPELVEITVGGGTKPLDGPAILFAIEQHPYGNPTKRIEFIADRVALQAFAASLDGLLKDPEEPT